MRTCRLSPSGLNWRSESVKKTWWERISSWRETLWTTSWINRWGMHMTWTLRWHSRKGWLRRSRSDWISIFSIVPRRSVSDWHRYPSMRVFASSPSLMAFSTNGCNQPKLPTLSRGWKIPNWTNSKVQIFVQQIWVQESQICVWTLSDCSEPTLCLPMAKTCKPIWSRKVSPKKSTR